MDKPVIKNILEYLIKTGIIKSNFTGTYTLTLAFRNGGVRDVKQRTEQIHTYNQEEKQISIS